MYYLMNKDSIVGSFDKDESNVFETVYKEHDMDRSKTPYGYKTIDQWLESRKASKHNAHLNNCRRILVTLVVSSMLIR